MPSNRRSLVGRIWITGTSLLIAFIAYSSQLFVIWPWYGYELSIDLLQLLVPFNLLVALLFWNYFLCVYTDPGRVPNDWQPNLDASEYEVKKESGGPRYCKYCKKFKPPRAHHCRQCRQCTLRMDHHCPWVDNCVGHYNYPHFIRFLLLVDIACSYHLAMVSYRIRGSFVNDYWIEPSAMELIFIILNFVACIPVTVMVGLFSLYHFYCLATNTTTIEGWEKNKVATLIRRGKIQDVKFPYDLGILRNVVSVFGQNPLLWCWPREVESSGLQYPLSQGNDLQPQQVWPPKDPYADEHEQAMSVHDRIEGKSPWTYGNGLNPSLVPSNDSKQGLHAKAPPYHPGYDQPNGLAHVVDDSDSESQGTDYDEDEKPPKRLLRRGSEGVEVLQIDREEIMRRYIATRGDEATRYRRCEPIANDSN